MSINTTKKVKKSKRKDANQDAYTTYSKDPLENQDITNNPITYKNPISNYDVQVPPENAIQMQAVSPMTPMTPIDQTPVQGNVLIVQNQINPVVNPEDLIPNFKTSPIRMTCPFCNAQIRTYVETHLNCLNLCCYCWTSCITWTIFQLCRGKDMSCSDARHFCPKCGKTLGFYEAC